MFGVAFYFFVHAHVKRFYVVSLNRYFVIFEVTYERKRFIDALRLGIWKIQSYLGGCA